MKHHATILLLTLIFILLFGCDTGKKSESVLKPVVSVSILPQKHFVEQIAGDFLQVNVILPPGSSPEDFEPTFKKVKELSDSDIYFYLGHLGFEKTWIKKFSENSPGLLFISCSKGIDLLRGDEYNLPLVGQEEHSHSHGTDPHIWTSPENVKTIAITICTNLSLKYPQMKTEFEKNRDIFIEKINQLDYHIRTTLEGMTRSSFLIFHPSLGYYARDYHLEQHSVEFEGKSPGTAQMKAIVDLARKEQISTIFIQSQFETDKAKAIAKELNATVIAVDPLSGNWLDEMYSLTEKMKTALQ